MATTVPRSFWTWWLLPKRCLTPNKQMARLSLDRESWKDCRVTLTQMLRQFLWPFHRLLTWTFQTTNSVWIKTSTSCSPCYRSLIKRHLRGRTIGYRLFLSHFLNSLVSWLPAIKLYRPRGYYRLLLKETEPKWVDFWTRYTTYSC